MRSPTECAMAEQHVNGLKLAELAKQAGVSPRTVRLYIARGLLPGPLRRGKGALYGQEHLQRLAKIRDLQAEGLTLRDIGLQLNVGPPQLAMPMPVSCWQYAIADDVVVSVQADVSPWRKRRIHDALARLAAELAEPGKENEQHESND